MFFFPEIASRTSSPTISSPSASDCGSPTELGMLIFCILTFSKLLDFLLLLASMPLFTDGPAIRTFFGDGIAKGQESDSSAQTLISNPQSHLWKHTSKQLLDIGRTNPEHFWTIQSHIRQLADVYRLETSTSHLCCCHLLLF
jgi:hypothetical protein